VVLGFRLVSTGPDVYESVLNVYEAGQSGTWTRSAVLLQGEGVAARLGTFPALAMTLAADTLAVGLPSGSDGVPSEVRVYERASTGSTAWTLIDTIGSGELIGCSTFVEIDGDTIAVTAIGASWIDLLVFERGAGTGGANDWAEIRSHRFTVATYADVYAFWASASIRLHDDTIALGMVAVHCISMDPASPCAPGVVQVVRRDAGGAGAWGVDEVLQPNPAYADQGFGVALDISADGKHIVVGTNPRPTDDPNRGGEFFVFEREGS